MLSFKAKDAQEGVQAMATKIAGALNADKKVLWLVCGGSNISAAVSAMELVRKDVVSEKLSNLTVAQTDERYGKVGHKDSNWKQMLDAGFVFGTAASMPMLIGKSLDATVTDYNDKIKAKFEEVKIAGGLVIAIFGIGADGHIAGILPGSVAVNDPRLVCGYGAGQFIRITLTPTAIRKIDSAFAFASGESKEAALKILKADVLPLDQQPAQVLKELSEAFLYSDL